MISDKWWVPKRGVASIRALCLLFAFVCDINDKKGCSHKNKSTKFNEKHKHEKLSSSPKLFKRESGNLGPQTNFYWPECFWKGHLKVHG